MPRWWSVRSVLKLMPMGYGDVALHTHQAKEHRRLTLILKIVSAWQRPGLFASEPSGFWDVIQCFCRDLMGRVWRRAGLLFPRFRRLPCLPKVGRSGDSI